jgi:PleD family two-component response regulator
VQVLADWSPVMSGYHLYYPNRQPSPPLTEPITVSIGAVEFDPSESGDALLHRVDEALYEAKRSGRNRVVAA